MMDKEKFECYINDSIKKFPLEEQEKILDEMLCEWLPNLINKKFEDYTMCEICGKYSLTKKFKVIERNVQKRNCAYIDSKYNGNIKRANVEFTEVYLICPKCRNKTRILSEYSKILEITD